MKLTPYLAALSVAALSTAGLTGLAHGSPVQADYLASADQLAVRDAAQGLDWLDLSVSAGWTIGNWASQVQQNAGWRLATNGEVEGLLSSIFTSLPVLTVNSHNYGDAASPQRDDIQDFTTLFGRSWTDTRSYGLYQDEDNIWRMAGVDDFSGHRTVWGAEFGNNYNALAASGNAIFGMFIVRANVPEPGSLALVGLSLGALALARRRRELR